MPRIYSTCSDPYDYCRKCFPKTEEEARVLHTDGDGPDGRGDCFGYDEVHPEYADEPEHYTCHRCRKMLTEKDN